MTLKIYNAADDTLVDGLVIPNVQAGADSDVVTLHVYNDRGSPAGQPRSNVLLVLRAQDPAGSYVASGVPALDEQWMRARLTGQIAASHPEQQSIVLDWRPWGAYVVLELGTIYADCARIMEIKVRPPSSADETTVRWQIAALAGEYALPAPAHLSALQGGVLTGVGERDRSGIVRHAGAGEIVTPSDPADDQVHVATTQALTAGALTGVIASSHQLDQTDQAATPLAAGESYIATLTRGAAGVTVTKGTLAAADPSPPTPPAGEPVLADVEVLHQPGGTSVIQAQDVDTSRAAVDRLLVRALAGLVVRVHAGRGLYGGTYRTRSVSEDLTLPDDSVTVIGQRSTGLLDTWADGSSPPETTAMALSRATTAAGAITLLEDLRPWAGRSRLLRLAGSTGGAVGEVAAQVVEDVELYVERAVYRLSAHGGGAAGEDHVLEYQVDGATAYPGSATDDQRGRIAGDATGADLVHRSGIPEVLRLTRGQLVSLHVLQVPTGAAAVDLELILLCRVP